MAFAALWKTAYRALRAPLKIINTAFAIIARPAEFAKTNIDIREHDLARALYFFVNIFAVVFLIYTAIKLNYTGASEFRMGGEIFIQLALAIPAIYLANSLFSKHVTIGGVAQGALYADALFLLCSVTAAFLLSTLEYGPGEVDIIGTEFEKCLANASFVYWLLRGNLTFHFAALSETLSVVQIKEILDGIIVLPFCVLFAYMMKARYEVSAIMNFVFALTAFIICTQITYVASEKIRIAVAQRYPCIETAAKTAAATFNHDTLGEQLAFRINLQLAKQYGASRPYVVWRQGFYEVDSVLIESRGQTEDAAAARRNLETMRKLYCGSSTDFTFARHMNKALTFRMRNTDKAVILEQQLTPANC